MGTTLFFGRAAQLTTLLIAGLIWPVMPVLAQASKATFPWGAALGGQFSALTPRAHALLVRARLDRSFESDYNALDRSAGGGQLQRAIVLGGYEWRLGERWSGGLIEKIVFDPSSTRTFQTGGFLRHCGHIGTVQFRKRALAEHVATSTTVGQRPPNAGRIRLRADLDRTWRVGAVGVRPRLAYEVQFDVALQAQDDAAKEGQRRIDRAVLRAEVAIELGEQLSLVPYVLRQTEFTIAVAQYDANQNVKVPAGDRNLRSPTVGFDIRYTLPTRKASVVPLNRDLPTFEGYQD